MAAAGRPGAGCGADHEHDADVSVGQWAPLESACPGEFVEKRCEGHSLLPRSAVGDHWDVPIRVTPVTIDDVTLPG